MRPGDTRPATCERSTSTGRNSKGTPSASTIPEAESPAILQVAVETPPNCGRVALHFAGTCRTGRPKHSCASWLPGAGIDVEIGIQCGVLRLLVFKTAKMLLHVRQRTEQSFFFAAPQRNANGPSRFHMQRRQNPYGLQHHRGADAVVRSSSRVMPRVVMAP